MSAISKALWHIDPWIQPNLKLHFSTAFSDALIREPFPKCLIFPHFSLDSCLLSDNGTSVFWGTYTVDYKSFGVFEPNSCDNLLMQVLHITLVLSEFRFVDAWRLSVVIFGFYVGFSWRSLGVAFHQAAH